MNNQQAHVAIAILYREGKFLMQLRDNNPNIIYPGHWAFFGGHIEEGETSEVALKRELSEEIGYIPSEVFFFGDYPDQKVIRHVYYAPLLVELNQLVLGEGWDMGLFTIEDIHRGEKYSEIAQRVCPLGLPHQKMLLEFIDKNLVKDSYYP